MMKVDEKALNGAYRLNPGSRNKIKHEPNFTGASISMGTLDDAVASLVPKHLRVLKKLGSNSGEIQNIIINSIGTGIVAPIFIKYNCFSKTDEDTRTYSAWRQPVSAVLAVLTQCGLTAPFYKIFDNWANKGVWGEKLNKTLFMDDYYITKMKKRENPTATKAQIEQMVEAFKKEQKAELIKNLRESSTVKYKFADGTTKNISDKEYRNLLVETLDNLFKHDKALEKDIETTIQKRKIRSNYYRNNNQEAKAILEELSTQIANAKSVGQIDGYIAGKINSLRGKNNANEMIAILGDIQKRAHRNGGDKADSFKNIKRALQDNVKKMLGHVEIYSRVNSEAEVARRVEESVRADILEVQASKDFFDGLKKTVTEKTTVAEIQQMIDAKKKLLRIENSSLNRDFAEEVAKQLIDRTKAHMKCYKQIVGVFVSLAILPFTCTLLNWVYPRFMDVFFPNLSSKKHDNESSKLISQAPKKAEVA